MYTGILVNINMLRSLNPIVDGKATFPARLILVFQIMRAAIIYRTSVPAY